MQVHRITGRHYFVSDTGAAIWLDSSSDIDEVQKRVVRAAMHVGIAVTPKLHWHKDGVADEDIAAIARLAAGHFDQYICRQDDRTRGRHPDRYLNYYSKDCWPMV